MKVVDVLRRTGGSATYAQLASLTSPWRIRAAVRDGEVRRVAKGVYALAEQASPLTVARAYGGVLSHTSAAAYWGFDVVIRPDRPHVTVGRAQRRHVSRLACRLHWADVPVLDDATTPLQTVLDCARSLPFIEALAIADSALRSGKVGAEELAEAAASYRGRGRPGLLKVAQFADMRAESALESVLRARVIEAGYSGFIPQLVVRDETFHARADLGDPDLRILLEAESFAFHGTRAALVRDCRKHVGYAMRGWTLLRYAWEDVMLDDHWVATSLDAVAYGQTGLRAA